ncbi:MAG TPA: D-glycero-beta-D-manno-heptose-7-phosphate kinase [Burkholderiales bacterium]|nr:D-glycero-beta-D-manno-heptose-7-phosphate kinase [Burkholderiales bacterium]
MKAGKERRQGEGAKRKGNASSLIHQPASLARARVLVVGDVMLDRYWIGDASRISPEAPVPVVLFREERTNAGGAANVARNCAALGIRTQLLSVVGDDKEGAVLRGILEKGGVRVNFHKDRSVQTTQKLRVIGRQQQLLRIDFETMPSREVLAYKLADFDAALPSCDAVILSDYGKGGLAHIARMIARARVAGKKVLVDPKGDDYTRYKGAHVMTPNLAELREVVGGWKSESDLERRAQALRRQLGLEALLLTRGADGMTLYRQGRVLRVKAEKREVYDVTGAGDTVIAALGAMLAAGVRLDQAVRIANRAAGIVVGKFGTAVVTPNELFGKG